MLSFLVYVIRWGTFFLVTFFTVALWNRFLAEPEPFPEIPDYTPPYWTPYDSLQKTLQVRKDFYEQMQDLARKEKALAEEELQSWLQARKAEKMLPASQEVQSRLARIESANVAIIAWEKQIFQIQQKEDSLTRAQEALREKAYQEYKNKRKAHEAQRAMYELRVFLLRLVITLPLLALAVFWVIRKKYKSTYWPIYAGFIAAAVIVFFWKLYPYLPDYGYYVRYGLGLGLSLVLGFLGLKELQKQWAARQAIQKEDATQKLQKLELDKILMYYEQQKCPSCERSFVLKNWDPPSQLHQAAENLRTTPTFCRYCGTQLYKNCSNCTQVTTAIFPYCMHCGHAM